jgi:hypothetical protein
VDAVSRFGGHKAVGEMLQWEVAKVTRRPKGYWGDMKNLQRELDSFLDDYNLPMSTIPKKSVLRRMKRFDLIKAMEAKGGILAVCTCNIYELFIATVLQYLACCSATAMARFPDPT